MNKIIVASAYVAITAVLLSVSTVNAIEPAKGHLSSPIKDNIEDIDKEQWLAEKETGLFSPVPDSNDRVLRSIGALESTRDPKCHATATRLESLIYGTELSEQARYEKNELQKNFIKTLWADAADLTPASQAEIMAEQVIDALQLYFEVSEQPKQGGWDLKFKALTVKVTQRGLEHYGSIAYSLRALLAVQQEQLLEEDLLYKPLTSAGVAKIKELTDLYTLALLQQADNLARDANLHVIPAELLLDASELLLTANSNNQDAVIVANKPSSILSNEGFLAKIVAQKITSYQSYNTINNQLFSRNLQVYFALASLPESASDKQEFTQVFTQSMVAFTTGLYQLSDELSQEQLLIKESAVEKALSILLPHSVDAYEDVLFFPKYPRDKQLKIESYDMDAFRDTGLHWSYLSYALNDLNGQAVKEADPFAAELIAEGVAHFGVLLLRKAGLLVRDLQKSNEARLTASAVSESLQMLLKEVNAYQQYKYQPVVEELIHSAPLQGNLSDKYFTQIDKAYGLDITHRSSDWLSRQMRSYLKKDSNTGIVTVPPAFGGGGVAAEDIDGDGLVDLLILSGGGNKLYRNTGKGFKDITEEAGLIWNRKTDNLPGEPRQPLIADIDNDGKQDIVITYVNDKHRVYRNKGNGVFEDVTEFSNLGGDGLVGGPATLLDVNNDGLLDIYIAYFGNYLQGVLPTLKRKNTNGTHNELFINKGGFVFEKQVDALGANNIGWGQALTHTDINQDGWQDIIVGNDFGVNAYYINKQGKRFVDISEAIGTAKASYTMNLSLTDLNRDGLPDIYVSNIVLMNKDEKYTLPNEDTAAKFNPDKLANMRVVEGNDLFVSSLKDKKLNYQLSKKVGRGYSSTGWAWDADFWDVDNDGDEDLYVVNGMNDYFVYSTQNNYHESEQALIFPDASKASNVFFINNAGMLNNQSKHSGLDFVANSRSATYLDLEGDGDLDVLINNYHDKAMLFRNNAEKLNNNWIELRLQGAPEHGVNLDAIGAQLIIGFGDDGYAWRQVSASQGYLSVHPKAQHIGLGKSTSARVMVIWPNGERENFGELTANKRYHLEYGLKK
ncbi:CRTAC1 family protein [Paraglaciecola sp.]|nr:CRTAC1 family protein [Paraglaciecola sp.]MDB4281797.1 CRTAC1 family protein [Paraglaciecola sp.]